MRFKHMTAKSVESHLRDIKQTWTHTHLLSQEKVVYMPTVEVPEYNQTSAVTNEDFIRVFRMFLQGLHRPQ